MNSQPILGLVLAGGQSSRMKQCKALLPWHDNVPLWQHITNTLLSGGCTNVVISCKKEQPIKHHSIIFDKQHNKGPLAGISALSDSPLTLDYQYILILPCDMPLVSILFIKKFIHISLHKEAHQHFFVKNSLFPLLLKNNELLKQNLHSYIKESPKPSVKRFLQQINAHELNLQQYNYMLKNLNTPEEFHHAKNNITRKEN